VNDEDIRSRASVRLLGAAIPFLVLFVAYLVHLLLKDGYAYDDAGVISIVPYKYLENMIALWPLTIVLLVGVVLVLWGIATELLRGSKLHTPHSTLLTISGIWPAGIGVVLVVLPLLLMSAWNHTAYYPSTADLQSSLTIVNSCSSEFTLRTMFYVSLLIPFVLAYIVYAWWSLDKKKLDKEELTSDHAY
jgi:cytochrome d ubiquinol oxidase subunit II